MMKYRIWYQGSRLVSHYHLTNPTNSNASDLDSVSSNPRNNHLIDAKLSKIQIPKFNGKPIKWQNFGISFLQLFIVKHIPDVVKFSYLKGF